MCSYHKRIYLQRNKYEKFRKIYFRVTLKNIICYMCKINNEIKVNKYEHLLPSFSVSCNLKIGYEHRMKIEGKNEQIELYIQQKATLKIMDSFHIWSCFNS